MPRYFIDQRPGCVAVRDREQTDPERQGLHEGDTGVVFYRHGYLVKSSCPTCHQSVNSGWAMCPEDLVAAVAECERLNRLHESESKFDRLAMGM